MNTNAKRLFVAGIVLLVTGAALACGGGGVGKSQNPPSVVAGKSHSCALTAAGGLKCWGSNDSGQLGDGTTTNGTTPVDVSGLTSGVAAVAAGEYHTCALTGAGGLKCWGDNSVGQLGDGTRTNRTAPMDVSGLTSGVAVVATGVGHSCALTGAGGLKCWGENSAGQVGDGTTTTRTVPVAVVGMTSGVAAVAAGLYHSCALTTAGDLKCWGSNSAGQLGDGTMTNRTTPVAVSGLTSGLAAVATGLDHSCVLTTAGGLKCWGDNSVGQLGDGTKTNRIVPVDVVGMTSGVAVVAAGGDHTCALTMAGDLKCWGGNSFGQLGDGTTTNRTAPVDVAGLSSGVTVVAAGYGHSCALTAAGGLKCWGINSAGQLGDGTTTNRTAPVDVADGRVQSPLR